MTAKGVAKYNRRTGGNLKTAVTTPPSKLKRDQSHTIVERVSVLAHAVGLEKEEKQHVVAGIADENI